MKYEFGNVLKKIRKQKHFTQQMLAEGICSQSVLSRIENNEEIPNVVVMKQLCDQLNITIDQVMTLDAKTIQKDNEWMELLSHYFYTKQYNHLKELIERQYIENLFYSSEDMQRYYYYYGSCLYYIDKNYGEAISVLKTGLKCTYTKNKQMTSDMEMQLLSCIGKVLADSGRIEEGLEYLEKSVAAFYERPSEQFHFYLTKIFYNIASVYLHLKLNVRALELINQGIVCARKNNSYYFLDELFLLKGMLEEADNNMDQATVYVDTAYYLKLAAYTGIRENEVND